MATSEKYNEFNRWMLENRNRIEPFYEKRIPHETVDFHRAMQNVVSGIRQGDSTAADIGFDLLVHDPIMPFGKTIKSNLLNAFCYFNQINER